MRSFSAETALPGCVDALAEAFGPRPLLTPDQVTLLGVEESIGTAWEREQAAALRLTLYSADALATDPAGTATAALQDLPAGPLAVHLDVDVLDFIDAPLAENTDCRNTGPELEQLASALRCAARDPRVRALSIGELNPTRSAGDPTAIPRFIDAIAGTLAAVA